MRVASSGRTALLALLLATAVSCGDSKGPIEEPRASGSVSFSYAGEAHTGTFAAEGALNVDLVVYGSWAGAVRRPEEDRLDLVAMQERGYPRANLLGLFLEEVTGPGTYQLGGTGCDDGQAPCREGEFTVGFDFRALLGTPEEFPPERHYLIQSGSVTIESWTAERVTGTFRGTAVSDEAEEIRVELAITNGRFNLPLLERSGS